MTSVAEPAAASDREQIGGPVGDIARDIARGGLAGLVAGIVVGGLGGRAVMRLAALVVPDSAGRLTENGNRIGAITLDGTVALMLFGGLFAGLAAGIVWVTVSPWIPWSGVGRVVLTMPIAVALSGVFLVDGDNVDFFVLRQNALVVTSLLALLALLGASVAWVDEILDRRLPRVDSGRPVVAFTYAVLVAVGLLFLPPIIGAYLGNPTTAAMGVALLATGATTLAWWALRLRGARNPPRPLLIVGRTALAVTVVLGAAALVPEVAEALGMR